VTIWMKDAYSAPAALTPTLAPLACSSVAFIAFRQIAADDGRISFSDFQSCFLGSYMSPPPAK